MVLGVHFHSYKRKRRRRLLKAEPPTSTATYFTLNQANSISSQLDTLKMQFPTISVLFFAAGLAAAQDPIVRTTAATE